MKKLLLILILFSIADAGWLKNLYQRSAYIGCTRQFKVDTTLDASSGTTGALVVAGGIGVAKKVFIADTTSSTSPITGALTVAGGVGVAKQLIVGDSIYSPAIRTNRLYYGLARGDTIYSKLDTAHVMRVDTLNINQELMFPNRWDDVGDIKLDQVRLTGVAGNPTWTATGLGFSKNQFAIGDSAQGSSELFHKFKEGDSTEFHLHWYKNSNEAGATFVNWSLRYWIFNNNDSTTYTGILTKQDTIAAGTKVMTHHVTSMGTVATPNITIGAKIICMVKRIAASPATNPASNPFGSTVGIHKKVNTIGSHSIYIK